MSGASGRRMYRYRVYVNDRPHTFDLTGDPLHVEATAIGATQVVDFWADHDESAGQTTRAFQVFGTGQPLPDSASWWGTTARTPEGLVWHLFEVSG